MSGDTRAMSLRLPHALAKELDLVCAVDDVAVVEVVRVAIADYIATRRQHRHFQARLKEYIARARQLEDDSGE